MADAGYKKYAKLRGLVKQRYPEWNAAKVDEKASALWKEVKCDEKAYNEKISVLNAEIASGKAKQLSFWSGFTKGVTSKKDQTKSGKTIVCT